MDQPVEIRFRHGETVQISVYAKERQTEAERLAGTWTPLASADTATFHMVIAGTAKGVKLAEWETGDPQVALVDIPEARWNITIQPGDLPSLVEGRAYFVNFWIERAGITLWQRGGTFTLLPSILFTPET